jgi:hypothetical protein
MDESRMGQLDDHSDHRKTRRRRSKPAELVTLLVEMLLVGSVAYAIGGLVGPGNQVALMAMAIAVYVSGQHCKAVLAEVRSLKAEVRRRGRGPRRSSQPSNRPDYLGACR